MESRLDAIAKGSANRTEYLHTYFFGSDTDGTDGSDGSDGRILGEEGGNGDGGGPAGSTDTAAALAALVDSPLEMGSRGLAPVVEGMMGTITGDTGRRVRLPERSEIELAEMGIKLFLGPYGVWAQRPSKAGASGGNSEGGSEGVGVAAGGVEGEGGGSVEVEMVKTAVPTELCDNGGFVRELSK